MNLLDAARGITEDSAFWVQKGRIISPNWNECFIQMNVSMTKFRADMENQNHFRTTLYLFSRFFPVENEQVFLQDVARQDLFHFFNNIYFFAPVHLLNSSTSKKCLDELWSKTFDDSFIWRSLILGPFAKKLLFYLTFRFFSKVSQTHTSTSL